MLGVMANEPEVPPADPLGLERIEHEIRIEKLRQDIKEVTGEELVLGRAQDCEPELEEAKLRAKPPERPVPTPAGKGCVKIFTLICQVAVLFLYSLPVDARSAEAKTPKTSIPGIAKIGRMRVGYSSQEDVARKLGEGKTLIGGHPNSGRVWRIRGTSWRLNTDGFDYSERGLVIDQLSLGTCTDQPDDIPYTKLTKKDFCWTGGITLGMSRARVLEILKRSSLPVTSTKEGWKIGERGFSPLSSIVTPFRNWEATLTFSNDFLVRLDLGASPNS